MKPSVNSNISLKKKAGYRIYGILYTVFKIIPRNKRFVYFIMTHDSSKEGNCGVMLNYIKHNKPELICRKLTRHDTDADSILKMLGFIVRSSWELSRSSYVFMDNCFLPLAYLKLRGSTQLIQLWHGTGTIKRFGQHVNQGELKRLEKKANSSISLIPVSSESTRLLYSECFGVPESRVQILGLPRTDCFFKDSFTTSSRHLLESHYPVIHGKKLVLYIPTFRDEALNRENTWADIQKLLASLPDTYCLGIRLHPFLSTKTAQNTASSADSQMPATDSRLINLTGYPGINTLLGAADILVTDYSSVIFEYCLLDRPMIFYAYDLEAFERNGRSFYRDYRKYVPGPVVSDVEELCRCISESSFMYEKNAVFKNEAYAFQDGHSTERIYEQVFLRPR